MMASIASTFYNYADTTNVDLGDVARSAGWDGVSKLIMFFSNVATITATTTGNAALTVTRFPTGSEIKLTNRGAIYGRGGNGGQGGQGGGSSSGSISGSENGRLGYKGRGRRTGRSGYHGQHGFTGGTALKVEGGNNVILKMDNKGSIVQGGGGGGGGGGGCDFFTVPTLGAAGGCGTSVPALPPRTGNMRTGSASGGNGGRGGGGCTRAGSKARDGGSGESHRGRYGGKGGSGGSAGTAIIGSEYILEQELS